MANIEKMLGEREREKPFAMTTSCHKYARICKSTIWWTQQRRHFVSLSINSPDTDKYFQLKTTEEENEFWELSKYALFVTSKCICYKYYKLQSLWFGNLVSDNCKV